MSQIFNTEPSPFIIGGRSIVDQPEYSFSFLYKEAMRRDALIKQQKKKNKPNTKSSPLVKSLPNLSQLTPYDESFSLSKRIKQIRQNTREVPFNPLSRESTVSFSKDKIDIVFESSRLLREIHKRKANTLSDEGNSLRSFLQENKEISVRNVLIELLKEESDKLENKEREVSKVLYEGVKTFENDQRNFTEFSEKQKQSCKDIELVLSQIQKKNRELAAIERECMLEERTLEDEIEKFLYLIQDSKTCARFICKVLNRDDSKYKKIEKIYKEESDTDKKKKNEVDYIKTADNVIQNYNFCFDDKMLLKDDFLDDPNHMIMKFTEMEDKILRTIELKQQCDEEMKFIMKENKILINDFQYRKDESKRELCLLEEECAIVEKDIDNLKRINYGVDHELFELIKDLHKDIMGEDYLPPSRLYKKQPSDYIRESIDKVCEKERIINDLMNQMEKAESDRKSSKVFIQALNMRKAQNKEMKQTQAKQNLQQIDEIKREKAQSRFDRIIIQSRKTEPPYYLIKAKKKVEVKTGNNEVKKEKDFEYKIN